MPPEENQQIMQRMMDAFNTGDESIVDELVEPDLDDQTPFPGTGRRRNGLKQQIQALRRAFPDAEFGISQMSADGETVDYTWTMVGTHRGSLMGHGPTNRRVEHSGTGTVTFSNGKIVGHRSQDNLGDLLGKLGLPRRPR